MIKVFVLQAQAEVWEMIMGRHEGPVLPYGVLANCHVDFVPDVKRKVLQSIKQGPEPGGLARADASQRSNSFLGEDLVNANGKDISSVTRISGGGGNRQRDRVSGRQVAGFQIGPRSPSPEKVAIPPSWM